MGDASVPLVDLERLIARSELQLEGLSASRYQRDRLASYVARMDELLGHVEKTEPAKQVAKYQRAVDRFHALLKASATPFSSLPLSGVPIAIKLALSGGDLTSEQKVAHVAANARAAASTREDALSALLGVDVGSEKVRWESFVEQRAAVEALDDKTQSERLLAYHNEEQERLTEEMVAGSEVMKNAAMAINETLKNDKSRLEELDKISADNSAVLAREKGRIKVQTGRTCSFTLTVILICVVVLLVFIWMILIIRFSRK